MSRIVVVGPHPGTTTGFARVARSVARALAHHDWHVSYVALAERDTQPLPDDLDVTLLNDVPSFIERLTAEVGHCEPSEPLEVLFFGYLWHSHRLVEALAETPVRERIHTSAYIPVDHAPAPAAAAELRDLFDRVVPSTAFGKRTLSALVEPTEPVPHGVDVDRFGPLPPSQRREVRTAMTARDDDFLVGYFGRNSGHKRADLALRTFAHAALGLAVTCQTCRHLTVDELDLDGRLTRRADHCRACGGRDLDANDPRPMAMYLHTDVADRRIWHQAGGADLPTLAERFGVTHLVTFAGLDRPDEGHTDAEFAETMAAIDVHVMLSEGAGWELTVLESAACGVPNIVTDHAALPEFAGPFSLLVPPSHFRFDHRGCRAIADLDHAVAALVRLHDDNELRARLGSAARDTAAGYTWEDVGRRWNDLLRTAPTAARAVA